MTTSFLILVIDDNDKIRKDICTLLMNEGYVIREAANAIEALEHIETIKPDLIIQDFSLPDMDGIELNKRLRSHPNGKNVPILALTGFLNAVEETDAKSMNFTTFLIKPIAPAFLIEIVKEYLPVSISESKDLGQKPHILLVDDDPIQLKLLHIFFNQAGFKVTTAIDGIDALEKIKMQIPDAIVSDVLMPKLDGFELCIRIRQDPKFVNMPIILLSSKYIEAADKELAGKVGANAYLMRTSDPKELFETLEKLIKVTEPSTTILSPHEFEKEHYSRVVSQLEGSIKRNAELIKKSATQTAEMMLLGVIADVIKNRKGMDLALKEIFELCLDTMGIFNGGLYLKDKDNKLIVSQKMGYLDKDQRELETFFGYPEILDRVIAEKKVVQMRSSENSIDSFSLEDFFKKANIKSVLIIPLVSMGECFGILFLGSKEDRVLKEEERSLGRILGVEIGQAIALTETFEQLSQSEKRYHSIMEGASCGLVVYDKQGLILEVNKEIEKIIKVPSSEIIGKNISEYILPEEYERLSLYLETIYKENDGNIREHHFQLSDGTIRAIEYSTVGISIGGENVFLSALTDVTERNLLRSKAMLSDRLAMVGMLAAGVAHEINNPVAWIKSNLEYLREKFIATFKEAKVQDIPQEVGEVINDSIEGIKRIQDIVNNLRGFSRVEDSRTNSTDIHKVLDTCLSVAFPEIKYRASVTKDYAPNIPLLFFNEGKLHQVFLNILVNGAQAIAEGDPKHNSIHIETGIDGGCVYIKISDTGSGILPENLSKIFEPFFTTKSAGKGVGLGLTICHDIVDSMGGEIKVQSTVGQGSTFTVILPLKTER